jgi:hypothetical protein
MASYTSTIPVQMTEATNGASYELLLDSCTSASAPPLRARDTVTADTSGTSVQTTVTAAAGAPPVTGVTATPIDGSPSVNFTNSSGVFSANFPASSLTEYSWRIEVTIDPPQRDSNDSIVLDPILIVRKTN